MTHKVELHQLAEEEFLAAYGWYSERSETAARAFLREMDHAVLRISEAPERWPKYDSLTRRFLLARFPFSVIYRIVHILSLVFVMRTVEDDLMRLLFYRLCGE